MGPAGHKDHYIHGSRRAPRCLPCDDHDPLEGTSAGWDINAFKSLRACPCNLNNLCPAPNGGIINHQHCAFINWRPGLWYFAHGGAHAPTHHSWHRRLCGRASCLQPLS